MAVNDDCGVVFFSKLALLLREVGVVQGSCGRDPKSYNIFRQLGFDGVEMKLFCSLNRPDAAEEKILSL
jgi:hypothetical protein